MSKISREKFWELYKNLPQELKDAVFAEETGDNIYDICKRNEVEKELAEIVEYTGQVLVGVLAPDDFQNALEKEVKLKKETAKKVSQEINRFIFFPVKESLAGLYKIEIATPARPSLVKPIETAEEVPSEAAPTEAPPTEEKPVPKKPDTYREPIE